MRILLSFILFAFALTVNAMEDYEQSQTKKRIAPIGQVNIKEEAEALPKEQKNTEVAEKEAVPEEEKPPGKKVYDQYCNVCHQAGVAGAPKFRDENDWKSKMAAKSTDELVASAIKGLNAMPPKGTCMTCSDEEIRAAVEYMLPQS